MTADAEAAARPAPAATVLTRGYLHQVDVVRLLTFGSVIAVHVVAATTAPESLPARGVLMLLHFTRETFFVITGFVLFHTYLRKQLDVQRFWRRRYLLIGVPYVTWSAVYWWEHVVRDRDGNHVTAAGLRDLALQLVTGTAEYHLYFLLVSMQVYLVFPWLLRLVRATSGRHGALLATALAYQVALFWLLHDVLPSWSPRPAWVTAIAGYDQQLLPSYLAYVLVGGLAAVHVRRVQAVVVRNGRAVAGCLVGAGLVTEGVYLVQVGGGTPASRASEVLQPVMVAWTLVVTAGLLAVGLRYATGRRPGPAARVVSEGARISFGVFLVHPLVISLLLPTAVGSGAERLGQPWTSVALWVVTVLVSFAAVEVVARTPLSLPLTGRHRAPVPRRAEDSTKEESRA